VDITAYGVLDDLSQTLRTRGAELMLGGRMTETSELRKSWGISESRIVARHFPTLEQAVQDYRAMRATERANAGTETAAPSAM
jgi:hypothetical protein